MSTGRGESAQRADDLLNAQAVEPGVLKGSRLGGIPPKRAGPWSPHDPYGLAPLDILMKVVRRFVCHEPILSGYELMSTRKRDTQIPPQARVLWTRLYAGPPLWTQDV